MNDQGQSSSIDVLSDRERAVAERFASGMTYREIGEKLFIAPSTVRTHLAAIYVKLGVRNKVGLAALFAKREQRTEPATLPDEQLPVVAVFPIECLNIEDQWQRFVSGLTNDIIVDLARHSGLPVIAHHTMKSLASRPETFLDDGRALGASYLLSGQLRAADQRVRLSMQLSDAATGVSLWSERYDRKLEDIFTLQDSLTGSVINTLGGNTGTLATLGRNAARRKPPANLRAYDYFLLGMERHILLSPAGIAEAMDFFQLALELDPNLAAAWTELGFNHSVVACSGYNDDLEGSIREWRTAAMRALQLDPSDSVAQQCFGDSCAAIGDFEGCRLAHQRALEYGVNDADTLASLAGSRALVLGEPREGIDLIDRAMSLNPLPPGWYYGMKGRVMFVNGRHAESLEAIMRSTPDSPSMLLFGARASAELGDNAGAQRMVAELGKRFPKFTVQRFISGYPVTNPYARELIVEGAKELGLR